MRLIDADELKAKYPTHKSLNQKLDDAPTADVAPVVHGEWLDDKAMKTMGKYCVVKCSKIECSACGHNRAIYETKSNYCSHCGAKMDGTTNKNN